MNILIVAGGQGTRLWPASRKSRPKQLLTLLNKKTLLQNTYERFLGFTKPANIFLATTKDYAVSIGKQLPKVPKKNFSIEPVLRDRGPAIGLAALLMDHYSQGSSFVTAWSDHHIEPKIEFWKMLKKADGFLSKHPESIILVGVKPYFPHTGMGYIQVGKKNAAAGLLNLFAVKSFKEKPSLAVAQNFLKQKGFLWNTGIFIWKTNYLLRLYRQHLPHVFNVLMQIKPYLGTKKQQWAINKYYPSMPTADIESGIIEKVKHSVYAIEANFNWADIGGWKVIKDIQSKPHENISRGLHVDHASTGTLVYNYDKNHLVATLGLANIIVVHTKGATLLASTDRSEEIKELIKLMKQDKKLNKFL